MARLIAILVLITTYCFSGGAQTITTDEEGEAILRMPDGSWRYLESGDTIYGEIPSTGIQQYRRYLAAAELFEIEVRERADEVQQQVYTVENQLDQAKQANDQFAVQEIEQELKELHGTRQEQEDHLKFVRRIIKKIQKIGSTQKYERLAKISIPQRYFDLAQDLPEPATVNVSSTASEENNSDIIASPTKQDDPKEKMPTVSYTIPNAARLDIGPGQCRYAFDGTDEISGNARRDLEQETLFAHTDPRLRPYFLNRDYISANAYLSSVAGGYRYLTLLIRIASKNARREYGILKPRARLDLVLIDGSSVSLFNQNGSTGSQSAKTGDMIYRVNYAIDIKKAKLLSRTELDRLRIVWSTGYEDYVIYNVDFFMRQFQCLDAKLK